MCRMLETLADKVRPAHTALLVIDMQNDFCAKGGLVDRGGRDVSAAQEMAARLPTLIDSARKSGVLVVFVAQPLFDGKERVSVGCLARAGCARRQGGGYTLTPVCGDGTWNGDYYGDIWPLPDEIVVTKHRYSAFQSTDLELILRSNGIRTTVITGVSTNVCVETAARDSFLRDFYTVLVGDADRGLFG